MHVTFRPSTRARRGPGHFLLVPLLLCASAALADPMPAEAQEATRLLRQPTVSATHIAFAYANDLWIVPRSGGDAVRLTTFQGQETDPHLSPDGQWLAFSASTTAIPTSTSSPRPEVSPSV